MQRKPAGLAKPTIALIAAIEAADLTALILALEAGRNYGVLLLDGADAASVDIVLLDDFVVAP